MTDSERDEIARLRESIAKDRKWLIAVFGPLAVGALVASGFNLSRISQIEDVLAERTTVVPRLAVLEAAAVRRNYWETQIDAKLDRIIERLPRRGARLQQQPQPEERGLR